MRGGNVEEIMESLQSKLEDINEKCSTDLRKFFDNVIPLYIRSKQKEQELALARTRLADDGSQVLSPYQKQLIQEAMFSLDEDVTDEDVDTLSSNELFKIIDRALGHSSQVTW
jgi:hypothetical protein